MFFAACVMTAAKPTRYALNATNRATSCATSNSVTHKSGLARSHPWATNDCRPIGVIPRTPAEIRWGAVLSINAGLTEEIFFRLLMPLTWYALTGNALVALLISVVLFGVVHAYQGVIGVIATLAVGLALTLVYLATQQIWLAMLVHALIDLRALVFLPLAKRN